MLTRQRPSPSFAKPHSLHLRYVGYAAVALLAWASALVCVAAAQADTLVSERLLGLTEQELASAVPQAIRNVKPAVGPRGSRGLWTLADADVAGLRFEVTFYFKNKVVGRIEERRRTSDTNRCNAAYTALLGSLSSRYGVAVLSDDGLAIEGQSRSAAWAADTFKVAAYRMPSANQCDLLVAIEPLAVRDASDL